jgi:hypothetical protein
MSKTFWRLAGFLAIPAILFGTAAVTPGDDWDWAWKTTMQAYAIVIGVAFLIQSRRS